MDLCRLSDDVRDFLQDYVQSDSIYEELDIPITLLEITKATATLKNNKSPGPDGVIYECLKNYTLIYHKVVTLFNEILSSGIFPEGWKLGHILPIHKKGPINEVNNYRGITLLNCFAKLFSKVMNHRLCSWAEKYSVSIWPSLL